MGWRTEPQVELCLVQLVKNVKICWNIAKSSMFRRVLLANPDSLQIYAFSESVPQIVPVVAWWSLEIERTTYNFESESSIIRIGSSRVFDLESVKRCKTQSWNNCQRCKNVRAKPNIPELGELLKAQISPNVRSFLRL